MKRLILMRHAKSDWSHPGRSDHDRPLNRRGVKAAPAMGAWLIARGMSTLPLRMRAHESGAMAVAEWLEAQKSVARVIYPGLKSHPQFDLAQRQMTNTSGMITFQVGDTKAGEVVAQKLIDQLEIIHYAVSLGHHRSLIFWIGTDEVMPEGEAPLMAGLGGDFFCAPFAASEHGSPLHGWPPNHGVGHGLSSRSWLHFALWSCQHR